MRDDEAAICDALADAITELGTFTSPDGRTTVAVDVDAYEGDVSNESRVWMTCGGVEYEATITVHRRERVAPSGSEEP